MTKDEILNYNKLCAELIGAVPCKDWQGYDGYEHPDWYHSQWSNKYQDNLELYSYRYSELKFDFDWNWIMKVIEAIENKLSDSFNVDIVNKNQCEIVKKGEEYISGYGFETINHSKIEAVVKSINQFLIWYNTNFSTHESPK